MPRETIMDDEHALRLRIYIGEDELESHVALHDILLERFMQAGIAGVTVLQGIAGYGAGNTMRTTKLLRFSADLPVIVEAVDSEAKIHTALAIANELVKAGMITTETVHARQYRRIQRS